MALFNRQNNSDIPPELQPYYDAPPAPRRNWLSWIVRGLAFIVLAAVIVVLVRWSWHEARGTAKDTAPGVSTAQSSQGKVGSSDGGQAPTGNAKDTSGSPAPAPRASAPSASDNSSASRQPAAKAPAAATPAPAAPAQTTLTNTGPGSLAALLAAAVIGSSAVYQYKLRRSLKN